MDQKIKRNDTFMIYIDQVSFSETWIIFSIDLFSYAINTEAKQLSIEKIMSTVLVLLHAQCLF